MAADFDRLEDRCPRSRVVAGVIQAETQIAKASCQIGWKSGWINSSQVPADLDCFTNRRKRGFVVSRPLRRTDKLSRLWANSGSNREG